MSHFVLALKIAKASRKRRGRGPSQSFPLWAWKTHNSLLFTYMYRTVVGISASSPFLSVLLFPLIFLRNKSRRKMQDRQTDRQRDNLGKVSKVNTSSLKRNRRNPSSIPIFGIPIRTYVLASRVECCYLGKNWFINCVSKLRFSWLMNGFSILPSSSGINEIPRTERTNERASERASQPPFFSSLFPNVALCTVPGCSRIHWFFFPPFTLLLLLLPIFHNVFQDHNSNIRRRRRFISKHKKRRKRTRISRSSRAHVKDSLFFAPRALARSEL